MEATNSQGPSIGTRLVKTLKYEYPRFEMFFVKTGIALDIKPVDPPIDFVPFK